MSFEIGCGPTNSSWPMNRILPPVYFLLAIVLMGVLHWLVPVVRWLPSPWNLFGVLPLGLGITLAVTANRQFAASQTPIHPQAQPLTLVTSGPFGNTRNPMYLGLTLALIGIAALLGSVTPWIVIPAFATIMNIVFIPYEERILEAQFTDEYRAYKQRVRRWV